MLLRTIKIVELLNHILILQDDLFLELCLFYIYLIIYSLFCDNKFTDNKNCLK